MSGAPPPYPPPFPPAGDWKYQRRAMREQARAQREFSRNQWRLYREQQRAFGRRSRSSSILGPLLVIGIGVVFLLLRIGALDYSRVGLWYGRWWPLLLVTAGVVLLAEWAFERSRSDDPARDPRTRLGGGVVFLLILLCIPGIVLSAAHGDSHWLEHGFSVNEDNLDTFLGDRHESDQQLEQAIPAGTALVVDDPHGDVTVTGSSDDGTIHIAVHKQVFTRSDSDASAKAARLAATISVADGVATLNVPSVEGGSADLTITLPTTTRTTVTADHGSVHLSSLKAPATVTANHGDVELNAIGGTVTSHMNHRGSSFSARGVRGGLTLEGNCRDVDIADVTGTVTLNGDFFGKTHFERVSDAVRFHTSRTDFQAARLDGAVDIQRGELSADQIVGPVALTARNYNVSLDRVAGDVAVTTSDGSVDLTSAPPLGNVNIQNRNGSVTVTVPQHAAFAVEAETRNGDVETDLPLSKSDDNHVQRLSGTVGAGGSMIRINTTQNDISLKSGVVAPLAPPAPPITFSPPEKPIAPKHVSRSDATPPTAP